MRRVIAALVLTGVSMASGAASADEAFYEAQFGPWSVTGLVAENGTQCAATTSYPSGIEIGLMALASFHGYRGAVVGVRNAFAIGEPGS